MPDRPPPARAPLQAKPGNRPPTRHAAPHKPQPPWAPRPNRTGLPDRLKAGVEALSGVSMDDVRVHRNSSEPARLEAHAYAQGSDIHLGPGQEQHLPHEAWHVVQQKQGRVRVTKEVRGDIAINDDPGLEAEAQAMGSRASTQRLAHDPAQSGTVARAVQPVAQLASLANLLLSGPQRNAGGDLLQLAKWDLLKADEENGENSDAIGLEGSGDFVWTPETPYYSRWLSHVHLFGVDGQQITGQLTVRQRQSDAGGAAFTMTADDRGLTDDAIRDAVAEKFDIDSDTGKAARDAGIALMELLQDRWKDIRERLEE